MKTMSPFKSELFLVAVAVTTIMTTSTATAMSTITAAFTPSLQLDYPYQQHRLATRTTTTRSRRRQRLTATVADAQGERSKNQKRPDDDPQSDENETSSSWFETKSGGFLPNLLGRGRRSATKNEKKKPLVLQVTGIEDYKSIVVDEAEKLVVVRFYAPWCRACKAVQPLFRQLSYEYPNVKLVEVPLTKENTYLHQGLGVPSLPFGHIYHPEAGLVEERSLNKKVFSTFRDDILKCYVQGYCDIDWDDASKGAIRDFSDFEFFNQPQELPPQEEQGVEEDDDEDDSQLQ